MKKRLNQENSCAETMMEVCAKYPMALEGRKNEYTILKHIYIYNEYNKIRNEVAKRFPEIVDYLPQKYYYMIVSQRFSLTPNYVCALVGRIKRLGNEMFKEAESAKSKIIEDEHRRNSKRKRRSTLNQ